MSLTPEQERMIQNRSFHRALKHIEQRIKKGEGVAYNGQGGFGMMVTSTLLEFGRPRSSKERMPKFEDYEPGNFLIKPPQGKHVLIETPPVPAKVFGRSVFFQLIENNYERYDYSAYQVDTISLVVWMEIDGERKKARLFTWLGDSNKDWDGRRGDHIDVGLAHRIVLFIEKSLRGGQGLQDTFEDTSDPYSDELVFKDFSNG